MTKRTTIKYDEIKIEANKVFRESLDSYADGRRHIQTFVENLLMKADHYKGFGYLTQHNSVKGNSIGMKLNADGRPTFFDETRIEFF